MNSSSGTPILNERHAVVTGGSRGIGAAIARALVAAGARVTVMSRTEATPEDPRIQAVACDVAEAASVSRAFERAASGFGPVHVLVNNAGQTSAAPFQELALEDLQRLLTVNVAGTMLCAQQVLPAMRRARAGRIVNIASTAGLRGYATAAGYCASKHGVIGLTRSLALEVAREGVTVNAVCPGYVDDTEMFRTAVTNLTRSTGRSEEEARARLAALSPRGALVTADEVASTVVWLCSPGASAITGQAIAVAGGEVM